MNVNGAVASGQGFGTRATQLSWFRRSISALYGFDPHPGTLNVHIRTPEAVEASLLASGTLLVPPTHDACTAFLLPAELHVAGGTPAGHGLRPSGVRVVLVRPLVEGYARGQLELVADRHLRGHLALADDDSVIVTLVVGQAPSWFQA